MTSDRSLSTSGLQETRADPVGRAGRWEVAVPLLIVLVLSAATHLLGLSHPRSVVFDEVHFGDFATAYCCHHRYFFDVHPPHAKLLIAGAARLLGYHGGVSFSGIGQPYGEISPIPLRIVPALAGTCLPLIFFGLLRQLGASAPAALFGGLLLVFDNALTLHTRIVEPDGILLAATFGALSAWLAAERASSARRRTLLDLAAGGLVGLAMGTKFLGLAVAGLIGLLLLLHVVRDRRPGNVAFWLKQAAWVGGSALLVYALGWVLHFALLTQPGPGDIWGRPTGHLFADIVRVHRTMLSANVEMQQTHPYGSRWWSWPLMVRPIYYWAAKASPARMYLIGNPLVWWGGTLMFVVVVVDLALSRVTTLRVDPLPGRERPRFWLPCLGFAAFYLPLAAVSRVLFMYHYFTPLLFSLLLVVLWLDHAGWTRPASLLRQRASYHVAIALLVLCFAALAPLTYGLDAGAALADRLFRAVPSWR
jgi:dolichyl-phosphate-mannose-protein mannosyltransferase